MNEYLLEQFLAKYYLFEGVCGDFVTDGEKKQVFYHMAKIFCLEDTEQLAKYFEDSSLEHFAKVKDLASYERLCRTIEFAKLSGQEIKLSDRDRTILAKKREAMTVKNSVFKLPEGLTKDGVCTSLLNTAHNGSIDAMMLLSYLEYCGICVSSDERTAIKRIRLCAKWNDLFGNLMGLAVDAERRSAYADTLYTVLTSSNHKQVFDYICQSIGADVIASERPIARIIEKAFGFGIVKRNFYDESFAKIAFCQIISDKDKEKLLLNRQKDAIVSLGDIPFDAKYPAKLCFDKTCRERVEFVREDELKGILTSVGTAINCSADVYTPLMIEAPDEYVAKMYVDMLKNGFKGSFVKELDAASLCEMDLAPTRENVILRTMCETGSARTVFIIRHCEKLDERSVKLFTRLLDPVERRSWRMASPQISLDLSGLMFILVKSTAQCFASELASKCDLVRVGQISAEEKRLAIRNMFGKRAASFGRGDLVLDEECGQFLATFDTLNAQKIIDGAIKTAIYDDSQSITLTAVKEVCKQQNIDTVKKGFGFSGGGIIA